ncbi:MAG: Fe-S cluster assembly protein HesB [Actinobacteria bacterium]|nr:Fe-S cluster assembly protein HesB [Actinomycetota bacterium]
MARRRALHDTPFIAPALAAELQARILSWYAVNGRDLPWRRTTDPYAVLVSEVMLQQTQVPRVIPKFTAFLAAYPRLDDLAEAPLHDVLRLWKGLGYNNRARRLRDCAAAAVAATGHPAELPRSAEGLRGLPGVGPYTARAVLAFAHNDDVAAVDANVRRVLTHELGLAIDLGTRALQMVAEAVLPRGRSRDWHNALMDYGALLLTARATGIAPRTRQGAFEGSRRWYRSRLLQALLERGPQRLDQIAVELDVTPGVAAELVDLLARDGLVRRDGDHVQVA